MTRSRSVEQKPERVRRNEEEMERGRQAAARAGRRALLERWEKAHRISLRYDIDGDRRQAWLWEKPQDLKYAPGTLLAEEKDHNDFPSESFVAQVALGLQALTGSLEAAPPDIYRRVADAMHYGKSPMYRWYARPPGDYVWYEEAADFTATVTKAKKAKQRGLRP